MPIAIPDALAANDSAAAAKAQQAKTSLSRYMVSAMLAGAYVGVAIVLLLMVSAPFVAAKSPAAKLVQGSVFGVALTLVVFAGAELFTGNNMVMLQGLVSKAVEPFDVALVWVASLIGNFLGAIGFAYLVHLAGVVTVAAPGTKPGTPTPFVSVLGGIVAAKDSLSGGQLFARAVLCNFLVCLALWMAARASSDGAKLLVLWWALLAFVASGFEHSIANMTVFSLATYAGVATWSMHFRNLLYTIPGNIVGGGLLVGLAYSYVGRPKWFPTPAMPAPTPEPVAVVPAKPAPSRAGNGRTRARTATASKAR